MAVLIILIAAITQIFLFWEKRTSYPQQSINTINSTVPEFKNDTSSENTTAETIDEGIGVFNTVFLGIAGIIVVLSAIISGLLLHLCIFHIYISFLGLTTYEYIRNHRQSVLKIQKPSELQTIQSKEVYMLSKVNLSEKHRPQTLHCCNVSQNVSNVSDPVILNETESTMNTSHTSFYMLCTVLEETHTPSANCNRILEKNSTKFHCCAEYSSETGSQKIVKVDQCTFCSFRIKTPKKPDFQSNRCCAKAITKHHRWRRKFNCCNGVPLSPEDLPGISTVNMPVRTYNSEFSVKNPSQPRYFQIEVPLTDGSCDNESNFVTSNSSKLGIDEHNNGFRANVAIIEIDANKPEFSMENEVTLPPRYSAGSSNVSKRSRSKLIRPWPVRIRHMFRIINRYRHPRSRGVNSLKQNQIRPLPGSQSNDNISAGSLPQKTVQTLSTTNQKSLPSAPAPNRRKIRQTNDSSELPDTFAVQSTSFQKTPVSMRRQRRKNVIRNRSPTLSPIQESGLSNPTSPQLSCRDCTKSITSISSICGHSNLNNPSSLSGS